MKKPFVVAVGGGSGSGKSTVVRMIKESCEAQTVTLIEMDSYYKDRSHLLPSERKNINYDHPEAIDHELLSKHILDLIDGHSIDLPQYDFATHTRKISTLKLDSRPIVLIDGIFSLYFKELLNRVDLKIFVNVPQEIRLIRRMKRDAEERGRGLQETIDQFLNYVRPMHEEYVEPTMKNAHFTIQWENLNPQLIKFLVKIMIAS